MDRCCYDDETAWRAALPEGYLDRPEFGFVSRDPSLPDVLLVGDSISMSYTASVRDRLSGVANVHRPPDNCRSTRQILEEIESYLCGLSWRVIHFNAGIHDFTWMGPDRKACAVGTGERQVPPEAYRRNLERIVERLERTGATLVWATTTPVQPDTPWRATDDAVRYNAIAGEIMSRHGIETDDLYSLALPRLTELQPPQNVHFTPEGAEVLAAQVASAVRTALGR